MGALVIVAYFAVRADRGTHPGKSVTAPSASPSAKRSDGPGKEPRAALPADSGSGKRVVYSLRQRRVWLVAADGSVSRSFEVWPGTVNPAEGAYAVSFRREEAQGTDGVQVENIVYFANRSGVSVAFSNATDGASPRPSPGLDTGAIREHAADGEALWNFAPSGTHVNVIR
ncbi:hypothetical protein ACFY93_06420 [Streptomyces sp. NPDC008313]|uniref:hypothetical protein n=1 Tax=Streptomyces sp. NPDC008313 TaxID=3364826 RepID=UPI0036E43935